MAPEFSTRNLTLRPYGPGDAHTLFQFMKNPAAMEHTYVAPTLEHCSSRLTAYEAMRSTLGFAPWVACRTETNEVVGWGGLSIDPNDPHWGLEVSYAFAPKAWGQGFATELVHFSLSYAIGVLSASEVHAFAKPENLASARVLTKCGFSLLKYEPSLQRNHYIVSVPDAA